MYDLIIIWAWAAWYSASIYASRYGIKNKIISLDDGWMTATAHEVENYPGFENIKWRDLMNKFKSHSLLYWTEMDFWVKVEKIEKINDNHFKINTSKWLYESKKIIIATWNERNKLWRIWENEFYGKWVSYCVTCDWFFFKNRVVAVIWWWDAALTGALALANIASKVYLIYRKTTHDMKAERVWVNNAIKNEKIEILENTNIKEIKWWLFVERVDLDNWNNLSVDWIFIEVWARPNTKWLDNLWFDIDNNWYIKIDKRSETSVKWIFAAWDITNWSNHFEQIITGSSEAAIASNSIFNDLNR